MGELSELLYADRLVLMSETIEGVKNKFLKWKEAFESKGCKINLGKTKAVVASQRMDCLKVRWTHVGYAA